MTRLILSHSFTDELPQPESLAIGELCLALDNDARTAKLYTKSPEGNVLEIGAGANKLADLLDVDVSNARTGSFFIRSGEGYVASDFIGSINILSDIELNDVRSGQYLRYDELTASFKNYYPSYSIFELLDVEITEEPEDINNHVLYYDYPSGKFKMRPRTNYIDELVDVDVSSETGAYRILVKKEDGLWRDSELKIEYDTAPTLSANLNANGYALQNSTYRVNRVVANQPIVNIDYNLGDYWIVEGVSAEVCPVCLLNIIAEPRDGGAILIMLQITPGTGIINIGGFSNAKYEDGKFLQFSGVGKTDLISCLVVSNSNADIRTINSNVSETNKIYPYTYFKYPTTPAGNTHIWNISSASYYNNALFNDTIQQKISTYITSNNTLCRNAAGTIISTNSVTVAVPSTWRTDNALTVPEFVVNSSNEIIEIKVPVNVTFQALPFAPDVSIIPAHFPANTIIAQSGVMTGAQVIAKFIGGNRNVFSILNTFNIPRLESDEQYYNDYLREKGTVPGQTISYVLNNCAEFNIYVNNSFSTSLWRSNRRAGLFADIDNTVLERTRIFDTRNKAELFTSNDIAAVPEEYRLYIPVLECIYPFNSSTNSLALFAYELQSESTVTLDTFRDFISYVRTNNYHLKPSCPAWLNAYVSGLLALQNATFNINTDATIKEFVNQLNIKLIKPFTLPLNHSDWDKPFTALQFDIDYYNYLLSQPTPPIFRPSDSSVLGIKYNLNTDRVVTFLTMSAMNLCAAGTSTGDAYRYDKNRYPEIQVFDNPNLYDDYYKYVRYLLNFEASGLHEWYDNRGNTTADVVTDALQQQINVYTYGLQESVANFIPANSDLTITAQSTTVLDADFTLEFFVRYPEDVLYKQSNDITHAYFSNADSTFYLKYLGKVDDDEQTTRLQLKVGSLVYEYNNAFLYFERRNNNYNHIAVVRSGSNIALYIDGKIQTPVIISTPGSVENITTTSLVISFQGLLNSFRLTAYARYIKNFLVPAMRFGVLGGMSGILEQQIFSTYKNPAAMTDYIANDLFCT